MADATCKVGGQHEIVTQADDRDRYNPKVFDSLAFISPNPNNWGHCVTCDRAFRWSVPKQRWLEWPGGLGMLPQLTSEELEVLEAAIQDAAKDLDETLDVVQSRGMKAEIGHRRSILHSLATAVAEAQYHLWKEPEDDLRP